MGENNQKVMKVRKLLAKKNKNKKFPRFDFGNC